MVRRPRAPCRRAGCPAGGYQAARPRRCLGFGEVLGAAGRTPGCPAPWRAARQRGVARRHRTARPAPDEGARAGALGQASRDDVDLLTDLVSRVDDGSSRLLVVVDQFEEVWTVCPDAAERRQFLDTLSELATDPRSPVTVVLGVRADYLGELPSTRHSAPLLGRRHGAGRTDEPAEIRRAVERPAAVGQLGLEEGLADALVSDAGQEPGLLPLLRPQ